MLVEVLPDAATSVIWMNSDEVYVAGGRWGRHDDAEKEPYQLSIALGHQSVIAELVEEHRIGPLPSGSAPPLVEDRDDIVVIDLRDSPDLHAPNSE
jgi:hypothetical protein